MAVNSALATGGETEFREIGQCRFGIGDADHYLIDTAYAGIRPLGGDRRQARQKAGYEEPMRFKRRAGRLFKNL